MKETEQMQFMCHCFFCQWTTDVDTVMIFIINSVARRLVARNQCRHCVFDAQTTNDGSKHTTQHFCIHHIICHLTAARLIEKSKLLSLHSTSSFFYRVSIKMVRDAKQNKTTEPKKVPDKTSKSVKRTTSRRNGKTDLISDSNETAVHEKETMNDEKELQRTTKRKQGMNISRKSNEISYNRTYITVCFLHY